MEYWIIYDLASGEDRLRGSGPAGTAALQSVPEGFGLALVPAGAVLGQAIDLELIRAASTSQIDAMAEAIRMSFLTPGAGQAMTYQRKEAEARAWINDQQTATPFLDAEAAARDVTLADLAAEVVRLADAWTATGATIEGARMGAKAAVARAETLGAIVEASKVEWRSLVSSAAERGAA